MILGAGILMLTGMKEDAVERRVGARRVSMQAN
jgi:hypothetical protein